jgi:hypothetical protein
MTGENPSNPNEDQLFEQVKDMCLSPILKKIKARAYDLANADERKSIDAPDIFIAFQELLSGKGIIVARKSLFYENIFMFTVAALAIVFGVLGAIGATKTEGFVEVSKLLAGALVGGAAGAAVSAAKR